MVQARLYALIVAAVALLGGLAWGGRQVYKAGYNSAVMEHQKLVIKQRAIADEIDLKIAKRISSIQVKHVTIRQNLEKELTRDVIYRDCVASDRVLSLTNEAITGEPQPVSDSVVPIAEPIN